jgi:hypothetical protein
MPADPPAKEVATFAGDINGGDFFGVSWLKAATAATAMARYKISKRLRSAEFIPILLNVYSTLYLTRPDANGLHHTAQPY